MNSKFKEIWNKYEAWSAPMAMFLFLLAGMGIGEKIAEANLAVKHNDAIQSLNAVIADKDKRLREYRDIQLSNQGTVVDLAKSAADSSAKSAQASVTSAAAAQAAAEAAALPDVIPAKGKAK